jgi:membrane fusion protein, multidrug efflux system
MKPKSKVLFATSIATVFLASGCGGGHGPHGKAETALSPVEVGVTKSELREVTLVSDITGTVRSKNRASIAPKVTGEIAEIRVVTGQPVQRDELLVKITALEISSKLQSAQASLDKVRRDLRREEELLASSASTQEVVNDLRDQLRISQAMVKEAETILSYTEIRAPFDGVITRKHANEGDLAMPGRPVLEIENLGNLRVEADIPEALIRNLTVGKTVELEISGHPAPVQGVVEEIAPAADSQSRTFPVKIGIPSDTAAQSGQFAKVRVPSRSLKVVAIDPDAVQFWGQIERVFLIEDQQLRMRIVKTGARFGDKVEILSGLVGGEVLALRKQTPLVDGAPVR